MSLIKKGLDSQDRQDRLCKNPTQVTQKKKFYIHNTFKLLRSYQTCQRKERVNETSSCKRKKMGAYQLYVKTTKQSPLPLFQSFFSLCCSQRFCQEWEEPFKRQQKVWSAFLIIVPYNTRSNSAGIEFKGDIWFSESQAFCKKEFQCVY